MALCIYIVPEESQWKCSFFAVAHSVQVTIEVISPLPPVKHDEQIKKEHEKDLYLGSAYPPGKYMLRVCFAPRTSPPNK